MLINVGQRSARNMAQNSLLWLEIVFNIISVILLTFTNTLKQTYKRTRLIFYASSESKYLSYNILILLINQGFAKTRKFISFQNVSFVLHRRNPSKGILISKNNTFHKNIKYSTETLPICIFDCLKMLLTAMI